MSEVYFIGFVYIGSLRGLGCRTYPELGRESSQWSKEWSSSRRHGARQGKSVFGMIISSCEVK